MMQRDLSYPMMAKRMDSRKGNFRFPIYINDSLKDVPVDALELSERGRNCLMRAGYMNLYELFECINSKADLLKIRCCGNGTAQEIMEKIFIYQFNTLSEEKRVKFIKRVEELNEMNDQG